jgi:hypothetical protein
LLEAATQALCSGQPCLLLAFDTAYPEPLYALRPIPYPLGVAMVLNPVKTDAASASLTITSSQASATRMSDASLEGLRARIPAARSLPLMQLLAQGSSAAVVIEYLDGLNLSIEVKA